MNKVFIFGLIGLGIGGAYFWINKEGVSIIDVPSEIKEQAFFSEKKKDSIFASGFFFGDPKNTDATLSENTHQLPTEEITEEKELQEAKKLFESMALLSIEKANRGQKKHDPELERGHRSIEQDLAVLRTLLKD